MNLHDIRLYVRRSLNEEGESESYYSDLELNRYINESYREFVNIFPFPKILYELYTTYSFSVLNGTDSYVLPTDFSHLISLYFNNLYYDIMDVSLYTALNNNRNFLHTSYTPCCYTMGSNIYLKPVPDVDGTAQMLYIKIPDLLENDTDEPEINPKYHEIICWGAIERAKYKDNEFQEAGAIKSRMIEKINMLLGIQKEGVK